MIPGRLIAAVTAVVSLQGCAGVENRPAELEAACGPAVSRNSVRIIDARDEFEAGGVQAAIERAESSVGSVRMLDMAVHRTVHFAALKGNGAKRGCDVVIHVATEKNVENTGWDGHFVLLARRESRAGQ